MRYNRQAVTHSATKSGNPRPNLLWIWRDQPTRFGTGSQQRAAHVLDALADSFNVHLVLIYAGALTGEPDAPLLARCSSITRLHIIESADECPPLSSIPHSSIYATRQQAPARIAKLHGEKAIDATFLFAFDTAVFVRSILDQLQPAYLDLDEMLSKRQQRFLDTPDLHPNKIAELQRGLHLFRMMERQLLPQFREVYVASTREKENVGAIIPPECVAVLPNATRHTTTLPPASEHTPRTLMFVGKMDYFPNLDGAKFLLDNVWPHIRAIHGDSVRLHLVGSHPPTSFHPEYVPGIIFDRNRADIVPVYQDASICLVPIRSGGGTRVKILEAFALGRPVVSTTIGAEGLAVAHNRHLLIADEPEAFARACTTLLRDRSVATRLCAEASSWVQVHHSAHAVREALSATALVRHIPQECRSIE